MAKILLVEDEIDLAQPVRDSLAREHHLVEIAADGQEALARLRVYKYDLIILDWLLPKLSGVDVLRQFRASGGTTAVLMLTARSAVDDKELGLDSGADDYLTKPFHLKELLARVRALLRRPASALTGKLLEARDIVLDPAARTVKKAGRQIHLLPKEFALLAFLMRHPNQVFSAEAIIERVWESDTTAMPDTVRTHVKTLRKKIDTPGQRSLIATVHGAGYKFEPER